MGSAFFPLDEELGLLPGQYTPHTWESLVRLGTLLPFAQAVKTLAGLLGVPISKSSAVRMTEMAGAAYVALQTEAVATLEAQAPLAPAGAEQMVFSGDGAMVPLLHGQWKEVRTLVIGAVHPGPKGQPQTGALSYFSRLASAEDFIRLTLVETQRRGLEQSLRVGAVVDGAEWLQGLIDYHAPKAVRILDFAHAAQRLSAIAQVIPPPPDESAQAWTARWTEELKTAGAADLLAELQRLQTQYPDNQELAEHRAYLEKRADQMRYPVFQQQGWPIGSGIVESANKLVVEARLKGAGMHWQPTHVDPMLALRNIVCNDCWEEAWPQIEDRLRTDARQHQRQQGQRRFQARCEKARAKRPQPAAAPTPPPRSTPVDAPVTTPLAAPAATAVTAQAPAPKRPAADHPWRRSPIGRARFAPSPNAKS